MNQPLVITKMYALLNINLCKLFFATITLSMVILGCLINTFETHLPVFIIKTFRYGKFASQEESWVVKNVEVPKSYFRHFYFTAALIYYPLACYEVFSVYVRNNDVSEWLKTLLNFCCGPERRTTVSATHIFIAVMLLTLQTSRRFYDTHFVSVFSKRAVMNLSHYFIGMAYYPTVMLIILSEAPKFAVIDDSTISGVIEIKSIGVVEVFAIVLFLWAWYHQHVTTVILANLRKNDKGKIVSQNYKIPEGDWFHYLSAPHSTAEILMYTALTFILWRNTGWWYVYLWILSNQVETTLLSHWWYQTHFENFPRERKALIPFVY